MPSHYPAVRTGTVAAVLITLVLVCSCASGSTSASETSVAKVAERNEGCDSANAAATEPSKHVEVDLTSGGAPRTYQLYVPGTYDGSLTSLVVDLHGYLSGSDGQVAMSEFGTLAERAGFVVATPQGNSAMPYWNAVPHASLPDDVQFVSDVIDDVRARLCIDPAKVYVDGFSNGAFLASLIACRLSEKVAAVAAVAGLMFPADCDPSRSVPILAIHGTDDQFVSFTGAPNAALDTLTWNEESREAFEELRFADVTVSQAMWAAEQGCAPDPAETRVSGSIELFEFSGCNDDSSVQLYVIDGGGHTWPGSELSAASATILGPTTFDLDATETIWKFFGQHSLRG